MDVGSAFPTDAEAPEAVEPGEAPLVVAEAVHEREHGLRARHKGVGATRMSVAPTPSGKRQALVGPSLREARAFFTRVI